jgi:hypothetical protein
VIEADPAEPGAHMAGDELGAVVVKTLFIELGTTARVAASNFFKKIDPKRSFQVSVATERKAAEPVVR